MSDKLKYKNYTMVESTITIDGKLLNIGQSMTIRMAIQDFTSSLEHDGLGYDKHGKRMVISYLERLSEIETMIFASIEKNKNNPDGSIEVSNKEGVKC